MSEEGNKNIRIKHKGSVKALPLPLDLVALILNYNGDEELQH
jgi:hypothetical protein